MIAVSYIQNSKHTIGTPTKNLEMKLTIPMNTTLLDVKEVKNGLLFSEFFTAPLINIMIYVSCPRIYLHKINPRVLTMQ